MNGYNGPSPCQDVGFSVASSDIFKLNNVGPTSSVYIALKPSFSSLLITDQSSGPNGAPQIAASISLGINLFYSNTGASAASVAGTAAASGATTSPTDVIEAKFDSMLNSGMLANLLASQGINIAAPNNVQTARATRATDNLGSSPVCDNSAATQMYSLAQLMASSDKAANSAYKSAMIAFIVLFVVTFTAHAAVMASRFRAQSALITSLLAERSGASKSAVHPAAGGGLTTTVNPTFSPY